MIANCLQKYDIIRSEEKVSALDLNQLNFKSMKRLTIILARFTFSYSMQFLMILIWLLPNQISSQITGAEDVTINGTVISREEGMPLPGVNVSVQNSSTGAVTDFDGNYIITAPEDGTLVFSYIGFITKEVPVESRAVINVSLATDAHSLEEVILTGYSTQRRKDITGSVAVVDTEALKSAPVNSAAQALQGQASGVNVINSGVPGADSKILIRGVSSFGDTEPLVIVDGVQGDLNNINASDIESMQVLKDAGAAAIYGVRGANGVIVVTTNKGKTGEPVFSYESYYGLQLPLSGNPFNLLNSQDFSEVYNIANPQNSLFANGMPDFLYAGPGVSGAAMAGDPAVEPSNYVFDPINTADNYLIQEVNKVGVNWFQELFSPAQTMNHNLTASGGTDKAKYLFSLGYLDQRGTLIETYLKRYSGRVNTSYEFGENFRIGQNLNILYEDNPGFGQQSQFGVLSAVYKMMPIIPVYDIMGNYGGTFAGPSLGSNPNPVAQQKRTLNDRNHFWNILGNVYAEVDFLKNFTARTSIGGNVNQRYNQNFSFTQYENKQGNTLPNSYSESASYNNTIIWTNTLTYSNSFHKHNVELLIGSEIVEKTGRSVAGSSEQFFSTDYNYLILGNGTSSITNFSSAYTNSLFSLFSRLDYSYDDKYLIAGTLRRDGSSRFGSERRFGIFPSVSLGWQINEEKFMKSIDFINNLKLRGSYGVLGSQNNVSPENAYTLFGGGYGNAYYDITGSSNSVQQGFTQTRIGNINTGWEENVISNFGFDATLFNHKLDVTLEYYKKSINGLLFAQPLPATVGGADYPVVNLGDIENKGIDASVTYYGNLNNSLDFSINTTFTSYENKVIDLPEPGYFYSGGFQGWTSIARNEEGHPVSSFFGYDVIGLFDSDEEVAESPIQSGAAPGRFRYRDVDGDGKITPEDRTFIGDPNPDFTYGMNLGLKYKNFDFSTMFYGSQGGEIVNTIRSYTHFFGGYVGNKSNVLLDAWTPENMESTVPIVENGTTMSTSGTLNSYFIEDGSFFRLRSVILGYTLQPTILEKLGINRARIYAQGTNLFTITKYSGLDPELAGGSSSAFGIDYGGYPTNEKNYLLGFNISF